MKRRCVIERWVQRKTDQKLIFNGNYTQIVFFVFFFCFRIHFHYVLSHLFGLFGVRTCVSILWHTSLPKNATFAWKNSENHDFGDFWWFSCFWHDVTYDITVASYKVCLYFFLYQWTREGHSYPLVPHIWCFVNRFPRSWGGGGGESTPGCEMGPKSPALLELKGIGLLSLSRLCAALFIFFHIRTNGMSVSLPSRWISSTVRLRGHNWVYFAIGYSVLLPWIHTSLS